MTTHSATLKQSQERSFNRETINAVCALSLELVLLLLELGSISKERRTAYWQYILIPEKCKLRIARWPGNFSGHEVPVINQFVASVNLLSDRRSPILGALRISASKLLDCHWILNAMSVPTSYCEQMVCFTDPVARSVVWHRSLCCENYTWYVKQPWRHGAR